MTPGSALEQARHKLSSHYMNYVASWFVRDDAPSDAGAALLVPLAPKDLARAEHSIPITCRTLAHPISAVHVAGPDDPAIRALCARQGYRWIDEIDALAGLCGAGTARAMNGWIRQQMLKLTAPEITGTDRIIAFDSDTFPLRPTRFLDDRGRVILYTGERTREPYHLFTRRLTGLEPYRDRTFIAHCMMFDRCHLEALREHVESLHGRPWHEAVLDLVGSPTEQAGVMSEFEIYGTFLSRLRPDRAVRRYRANIKLPEAAFLGAGPLPRKARRFRFASSHIHGA